MQVLIDADGCPVVRIAVEICKAHGIPVTLVCDTSHIFQQDYAKVITVDKGADSADMRLVNLIDKGDIVITQDYGLAAMCIARKAVCLSQDGLVYDDSNIEALLLSRHISKKIRKSGGRLKGPPKRDKSADIKFRNEFERIIKIQKEGLI